MSCCGRRDEPSTVEEAVVDDDAFVGNDVDEGDSLLSHVGEGVYEALRKTHAGLHHRLWNVTSGAVVGKVQATPASAWPAQKRGSGTHDTWFPQKLRELMSRTTRWCDVMSLGPPDGIFMDSFQEALGEIARNAAGSERPVVVRLMFGNIVGMPVDCTKVIAKLTEHLGPDANIRLWVGAWRTGLSWNHAKIIAVDGRYLHTGGHNLWTDHYLKTNPVYDISVELEGRVAHDGHMYADQQWEFIETKQNTVLGGIVDKMPDNLPLLAVTRVTISEFPVGKAEEFAPLYKNGRMPQVKVDAVHVPVITIGRYGALINKHRPSDDAILAMFDAARSSIRLALQDLGPVCFPKTKIPLPGCTWPKETLRTLGRAIFERGVDVEMVLSNPGSIPGGLSMTEANYGNGWSCADVASELIKRIRKDYPEADDGRLRSIVRENLRICFLKEASGNSFDNGNTTLGFHAKHFIIDDVCCYIGSQNLYVCDLAEWGVVIDDEKQTRKMMAEYWDPMWTYSYVDGGDLDVDEVMDGLDIDRKGVKVEEASPSTRTLMRSLDPSLAAGVPIRRGKNLEFYAVGDDIEDSEHAEWE